ncbi:hypothetical protein DB347_13645 [Opitutaceae bacterium EW11]|nr:hypothetical protein DB347_13645 [Opitutaceae bacterium EW11]
MKRLLVLLTLAVPLTAEPPLSLDQAVNLALRESKGAQLARLRTEEAGVDLKAAKSQRYPRLNVMGIAGVYLSPFDVYLRRGTLSPFVDALGTQAGLGALTQQIGPVPSQDFLLYRGGREQYIGSAVLLQPLTQQFRIGSGVAASKKNAEGASLAENQVIQQVKRGVEELFAGILLETRREAWHRAKRELQQAQLRDAEHAQQVGEMLDDAVLGLQAELAQTETDLMRSEQQRARLSLQLGDLIGRPGDERIALAETLPHRQEHPLSYWISKAPQNLEHRSAATVAERARLGVRAARQAEIPDVSAFVSGFVQDGQQILPANGGMVGVLVNWEVFDGGQKRADVSRGIVRRRQAELAQEKTREDVVRQMRLAYQDYQHATELIGLAEKAEAYRRRAAELARQSVENQLSLPSKALAAEADLRKAEADLVGARLQQHLALLQLYALTGEL